MNNSAFRDLIGTKKPSTNPNHASKPSPSTTLGSRARSSIPMTPRTVNGVSSSSFSRQVAEHQHADNDSRPTKRFKSSSAPKGTRFGKGYQDRSLLRRDERAEEEIDDKAKRLQALEEMYKLQQIDQGTFEELKKQIGVGGNVESTHLVKGLDFELLRRIREGEDVNKASTEIEGKAKSEEDVEDELEQVLQRDVVAPIKRNEDTNPEMEETQEPVQTLTRDEILRRLKESRNRNSTSSRQAMAAPPPRAPVLGDRFKKLNAGDKSGKKKFIETIDGRRREVLMMTDKDGKTKRKSRWLDPEGVHNVEQQPIGMEVPAEIAARQKLLEEQQAAAEEEDDDIFAGAADYDPLAGIDSTSEVSDTEEKKVPVRENLEKPRNYFGAPATGEEGDEKRNVAQDPTILAALKRAAQLRQRENNSGDGDEDAEATDPGQAAKRQQFLDRLKDQERRDAGDMDMGFGDSRFGDDEDEDGPLWDGDEEGGETKKSGAGRKRGPKKRKGDKDNVQDVMSVLEGRQKK